MKQLAVIITTCTLLLSAIGCKAQTESKGDKNGTRQEVSEERFSKEAPCGGQPKYAETKMRTPKSIKGYFDISEATACAKQQNKPILLEFKGHGCANCKKMDMTVLKDQHIITAINSEFVFVVLYIDERTELPDSNGIITAQGRLTTTLGKINREYQHAKIGSSYSPCFVIMDVNEKILTKLQDYTSDPDTFLSFLDTGLKTFKKVN